MSSISCHQSHKCTAKVCIGKEPQCELIPRLCEGVVGLMFHIAKYDLNININISKVGRCFYGSSLTILICESYFSFKVKQKLNPMQGRLLAGEQ